MKNQISKLIYLSIFILYVLSCSSNSDNCNTTTCLNGGTFSNCQCNCPSGYSGEDCSFQIVPNKIKINKVIVKAFPNLNNGAYWDTAIPTSEDTLADIYITFQDFNLNIIYDSPTYYQNVISGQDAFFEFNINPSIELTNFENPYLINIWDYDVSSEDDFMTSFGFIAYTANNNFPDTITVVSQANEILVDLEVSYEW